MSSIAVVGAGPAGLMAADVLARAGLEVTVFDRMASVGRKFLLAGRGGLNITHSEELSRFLTRYGDGNSRLCAAIERFPPAATRAWCDDLGEKTFIGSSGRVFPNTFKSSPPFLRKAAALSPVAIGLLHEACPGKLARIDPRTLACLIQSLPLRLTGTFPIERAISTAGGIRFSEMDDNFMLRRRPGVFVAGEMLDWEAPTGGYLLQACLATGVSAARGVLQWLEDRASDTV